MKNYLNKLFAALLSGLLICTFSAFSVYAVKTDGVMGNAEWKDSIMFNLSEQKEFNNSLKAAVAKVIYDEDNEVAYLGIMIEFGSGSDVSQSGVRLSLNDGCIATVFSDGTSTDGGECDYEYGVKYYGDSHTAMFEVKAYLNSGLESGDLFSVEIYDMNGEASRKYYLDLFVHEDDNSGGGEDDVATKDSSGSSKSSSKTTKAKSGSSKSSSKTKTTDSFNFKKVSKTSGENYDDEEIEDTDDEQIIYGESEDIPADKTDAANEITEVSVNPKTTRIIIAVIAAAVALAVVCGVVVRNLVINSDEKNKK